MTEIQKTILVGSGLGPIKFGMERKHVAALVGQPDEREQYKVSAMRRKKTEAWHFDKLGVSMSFDEEVRWRMTNMSVTSADCLLEGDSIIGMNQLALINKLTNIGFDDVEIQTTEEGQTVVSSEINGINFWLEDGAVAEIQWMPLLLDEYTIKWPE